MKSRRRTARRSGRRTVARTLWCVAGGFTLAACGTYSAAAPMIVGYNFNDPAKNTTTANVGTGGTADLTMRNTAGTATNMRSASGGGASGSAGDYAFDLTSATGMGATSPTASTGPYASSSAASLANIKSFTMTGWLKPSQTIDKSARVMVSASIGVQAGSANQLQLTVSGTTASASLNSAASYTSVGSWLFYAITYDGLATTNNVRFYVGTPTSGGVTQVGATGTLNAGTITSTAGNISVGNNSSAGSRPFQGMMDNLFIYGSTTDSTGAMTQNEALSVYSQVVPTISLTSAAANSNLALGGAITVSGSNGSFTSEIDNLSADQNNGSAVISVAPGSFSSPVYAMLWLTGQTTSTLETLRAALDAAPNIDAYTAVAGGDQFATLGGAYSGFNLLVKFSGSAASSPGAINWNFGAVPSILVDKIAVVPEPGTLTALAIGAMGLITSRRRKK